MSTLSINGSPQQVDLPEETPLLWALRDELGMTGTKFGCGAGLCGACTVHIDGQAVRACQTTISAAAGKQITTIEHMEHDPIGAALQTAWLELGVPQCGYCQGGQIMSAAALLKRKPQPSAAEIDQAMKGNICRCGTYNRIHAAIRKVAGQGVKA
ncbi:MAG: (2Fe-2S)-binding protein [Burkholderiaceae bacterium]|jgi:isoquinoline 1-oxidoreductase alpha subunit|nr:(2Fe-2S)-binding protein [Burkholderiaceae bacterium]